VGDIGAKLKRETNAMDLGRVLGALLGGAAAPPRRRRRAAPSILGGRGTSNQLGRILGAAAATAIESMMRNSQRAPEPVPREAARPAPRPVRDVQGPWSQPAEPRRMPTTGASPWNRPAEAAAPEPEPLGAEDAEALLLIRAMIAAAKADGAVDATERRAIAEQLDAAGLEADERDFVLADFDKPLAPEALAKQASDPMLRARLYAAAVAAMGEITPPERDWLDRLAKAMKLDRAAAAAIEERLQG
jgi:tellurite resistance protein